MPPSGRVGTPFFSRVRGFARHAFCGGFLSPQSPRIRAVALGRQHVPARAPRGVSSLRERSEPLGGMEIPMDPNSSPRAIICPDCGKFTLVGSRGPMPERCQQCRAWRRRPVLPQRVAGKTTCSTCGAEVPVLGRRGRLPKYCPPCRREAGNARRRVYADLDHYYSVDELAELLSRASWQQR